MRVRRPVLALAATLVVLPSCASDAEPPLGPAGVTIQLSIAGLRPLDPAWGGAYEAWIIDGRGQPHSAGRFVPAGDGRVEITTPVAGGREIEVTVEPPGDQDPAPSSHRLLRGAFRGGRAELSVVGAVTAGGLRLRERPGQFTMFTPSDNAENGYPSHEYSGVWLFNMAPRQTEQDDMWVRLTQLRPGWVYEGWMVRDPGKPGEVWLSYGKFLPDASGAINTRDDTGWGPFSGVTDFQTAGEEEFPGDDWISNPLGYPVPGDLALPLDLREKDANGEYRWTHVITIEPAFDRGEAISSERPFLIRPYRDPFTPVAPGEPRAITFHEAGVPRGIAEVR